MKQKIKRLYFDIEISPNVVYSWNTGYNIKIDPENIVTERAIICICYKWEDEKKVHYLTWDKGNDKKLLKEFIEIINSADEVVGHNSDKFNIKWVRTRCLYHRIPAMPKYKSIDTLKLSKSQFKFNSNKLDYISKYLGFGGKIKTSYDLWKRIMNNDQKALDQMVRYCKKDVLILEEVYKSIQLYSPHKTHVGVHFGGYKSDCPKCGSEKVHSRGYSTTAAGTISRRCNCKDCNTWFSVPLTTFNKENRIKNNVAKI
jgi:hypothetical protein